MRREPWGTGVESELKYDGSSLMFWGSSGVRGIIVLPSSIAKKYNVFFLSTQSISKGVTPMILRQFDSCIDHYSPRCHFKTFLESPCSVIFILNPYSGQEFLKIFQKTYVIFQTINIYIMKKCKTTHFFYFFLIKSILCNSIIF